MCCTLREPFVRESGGPTAPASHICKNNIRNGVPNISGRSLQEVGSAKKNPYFLEHEQGSTTSIAAGDGSQDHLDAPVEAPKEMRLEDGQYELGRLEDAQLTIALPTVSGKHALLRVGTHHHLPGMMEALEIF